jgi:LacI family transcriptional regulator, galactose operon repressor
VSTDGDPPLTTVHQPAREMGRALVRQLLNRDRADPLIFPTHLVVRQSA